MGRRRAPIDYELALKREEEVLRLWAQGLSLVAIAAKVGYYDESGARKALVRAKSHMCQATLEDFRDRCLVRLEHYHRIALGVAAKAGQSDKMILAAIAEARAVQESERKLLGADAPARHELSGPAGEAIPIEVTAEALLAQLEAKAADKTRTLPVVSGNGHGPIDVAALEQ